MDFRRLFDIFQYQLIRYPQKIALAHQVAGEWIHFSTQDCIQDIERLSAGLLDAGVKKGDKVGLMFESGSAYFNLLDFAILKIGAISVPIHANIHRSDLEHILENASVKICITATKTSYEKVLVLKSSSSSLEQLFCIEPILNVPSWSDLLKDPGDEQRQILKNLEQAITENDLATIIYTSGTSGVPKGVMLSHKNMVSNIKATIALIPINCDKRVISFLPVSHVFERMVLFTYIAVGASIYYVDRVEAVSAMLKAIKPHYFASVPKLLERVYEGILDRKSALGRVQKSILNWALQIGERYEGARGMGLLYRLKLQLADLLVYRKWRQGMGGKVEGVVVGAAALQPKLGRLFSAAGIEIREGYGLTETAPVIAFNRFEPGGVRFGTVGIPIPGIQVKIDQPNETGAGEILVKGPGVMLGYYQKEGETAKVIDADGWFRTGDVGLFVHKRFLKITDRKKDIFKTSSGKYVAPGALEAILNTSPYIEQSFVIGFNRPYVSALLVPNYERLKDWCNAHKVHWTAPQYMALNPKVLKFMRQHVLDFNTQLINTEKIKNIVLLHEPWTVGSGELTPTLKLKRRDIVKKYNKQIEELYR